VKATVDILEVQRVFGGLCEKRSDVIWKMWSFNAFCPKANPQFSSPRL